MQIEPLNPNTDTINLNSDTPTPDDRIDLSAGQPTSTVPDLPVAKTRAAKASVGLSKITKKPEDDMLRSMLQGQEQDLRQESASAADFERNLQKQRYVSAVAQRYPDAASLAASKFDMQRITGQTPPTDPKSVFEEYLSGAYLKPMTDLTDQFNHGTFLPAAMQQDPQAVQQEVEGHTDILTRQQYFQTALENAQQAQKNQGFLSKAGEFARNYLPGGQLYQEAKLRGWTGSDYLTQPLGSAMASEAQDLYKLPWLDAKQKFDAAMKALPADIGAHFAQYAVGMPADVIDKENAADMLNLAGDVSVVGAVMRAAFKGPIKAISNINKVNVTTQDVKVAAAAGQGNMEEAATQKVAKATYGKITGTANPEEEVREALPTALRYESDFYRTNPGRSGQEIANRVAEDTAASQTKLEDAVYNSMKILRTPAFIANETVAKAAVKQLQGLYTGINSTVLDVGDPVWYSASNRYMVPISVGDHDGEMFRNQKQAESFAKFYSLPGKAVKQEGLGWYLNVQVPLDETQNVIRDTLHEIPGSFSGPAHQAERKGTQVPYLLDPVTGMPSDRTWNVVQAFWNSGAGKFDWRSPEETLSPVENEQRKIATFGPARLMQMFQDNDDIIKEGNTKQLKRVLTNNQNQIDPNTQERGRYYQSIGELETHYQQFIGRQPTSAEIRSYFAVKNNYEMERGLMSLTEIRNKSRNGVMSWRLHSLGEDTGKSMPVKYSDRFDAKALDHLPQNDDPIFVNTDKQYVIRSDRWNPTTRASAEDGIKQGKYRVLELWNRNTKPLHSFSDKIDKDSEPRYILTDKSDFQPLDFTQQVNRRGGGHLIPEYGWAVKQADVYHDPVMDKSIYRGDITAMPARNAAEAREVAEHLNKVREHLAAGNENGAREYVKNWGVAGLDFDKDILKRYQANTKPFNTHQPFQAVPFNKTIPDIDNSLEERFRLPDSEKSFLRDGTRHGNLSRTATVAFNEPRDAYELHTIENHGTPQNPVWQHRPAKLLDPMDSLNRSMTRLSNSFYMDDYRNFAAEHWLQTFGPWLNMTREDIRHAPLSAFYKGELRKGMPEHIRLLAESNRKKAMDFIGTPSTFQAMTNSVGEALMNSVYKKAGGKYLPFTELARAKDPLQVVRGLTFDMKLGLFALPTFWTQFSALSNVLAIAAKQGPSAAMAVLHHTWSRVNPDIIDELDKRASSGNHLKGMLGFQTWKPGQFKEAWNALKESSYEYVGSEHAMQDSMLQDRGVGTFMDGVRYWGRTAFREGAQAVRTASWYAAYLQHRDVKPTGALTRLDKSWILDRASMLDHNMSRASNSAINSGAMSVPAQFYTYARNLSEMFYGKRLTWQEKSRLFGVNAVLWGLPAGGIGLLGLPIGDYFRKQAMQGNLPGQDNHPYIPGENPVSTGIFDGVFSVLGNYITGKGDFQAGTTYDFSKFGVKGWDPINNFLDTDKGMFDFLGGASWQTIHNTAYRSQNFLADMADLIHGGGKFKLTLQDFADLFKEASGFSYPWKTYMALAHHTWMSNNNTPLENDVSTIGAIFRGISGLVSTDTSDININRGIIQGRADYTRYITAQAARNFNLALLAKRDNDDDGYIKYMTKGNAWLSSEQFPPDKRIDALHTIFSRKSNLVDSINWQLGNQNVPEDKIEMERNRALSLQQLRQQKGQ